MCLSISVFAVALTACNNNDTPGGTNNSGNTSENGDNVFTQGITYDRFCEIVSSADNITATRNKVDYANTAGITGAYQYENTAAYLDGGNVHHYLEYYYALEKDRKLKHMEYIFVEDDCTYTISGLNYGISSSGEKLYLLMNNKMSVSHYDEVFNADYSQTLYDYINGTPKIGNTVIADDCGMNIGQPSIEFDSTILNVTYTADDGNGKSVLTSIKKYGVGTTSVDIPDELYTYTKTSTAVEA